MNAIRETLHSILIALVLPMLTVAIAMMWAVYNTPLPHLFGDNVDTTGVVAVFMRLIYVLAFAAITLITAGALHRPTK